MSLITGTPAAEEYVRRYGETEELDRDLAHLLSEGLLFFDTERETFSITSVGINVVHERRVGQWENITDITLEDWESDSQQ